MRQLGKLEGLIGEIDAEKVRILAISVDDHATSRRLVDDVFDGKRPPGLLFLEDENHAVIDRYGLLNTESKKPVPHPATIVIDREGTVRWRFVEVDYTKRPTNDEVLTVLRESGIL